MSSVNEANESATIAAARDALRAGPCSAARLVEQLRRDRVLDFLAGDDDSLVEQTLEILAKADELWVSSDLTTIVLLEPRLDRAVFTHCVTEHERGTGTIALHPDLLALDRYFHDGDAMTLPTGGVVRVAYDDVLVGDTGRLVGPPGWLDFLADGDTASFVRRGQELVVERVNVKAGSGGREAEVLRSCFDVAAEDRGGALLDDVVRDALAVNDHAFRMPVRPIAELLARQGLANDGGFVGAAGVDFVPRMHEVRMGAHVASEFGFVGCCFEAFTVARNAFRATGDRAPSDDVAVAEALAHSDVARALVAFVGLLDDGASLMQLARFAQPFAEMEGAGSAGGKLLLGLVVEELGEFAAAASLVEQAVLADPSCLGAVDHFARQLALRGELEEAIRVRRLLEVGDDPELEFLVGLLPLRRSAAGRNDRCPCGSGRKFKLCCANKPVAITPEQHATWLHHKLLTFAFAPMYRAGLELLVDVASSSQSRSSRRDAVADGLLESGTVAFWALFEGDVAHTFAERYASVLPAIEAAMLADWLSRPLALYEIVAVDRGVSVTLRDTRTGDETLVRDSSSSAPSVGDLLLARVGLVDGAFGYVGDPLDVASRHRARTMALVETQPNPADMAAWFGEIAVG